MNSLVTYCSRTGNTRKIAEAIFDEIGGQKEIMPVDEVTDVDQYDIVFVGSPIEKHGLVGPIVKFLKEKMQNRQVALFITHAAAEQSEVAKKYVRKCRELVQESIDLLGILNCQGELSKVIAEHMMASENPELREYASMRKYTLNQPDEVRIAKSKQFAGEMMNKIPTHSLGVVSF